MAPYSWNATRNGCSLLVQLIDASQRTATCAMRNTDTSEFAYSFRAHTAARNHTRRTRSAVHPRRTASDFVKSRTNCLTRWH